MVTQKTLRKYMSNDEVTEIAREAEAAPEVAGRVMKALENRIIRNRRHPAPPPPEGGISLSEGQRRFGVSNVTIHRWAKMGIIPILAKTKNCVYVDEKILAKLVKRYNAAPGRGKHTAYKTELQTAR